MPLEVKDGAHKPYILAYFLKVCLEAPIYRAACPIDCVDLIAILIFSGVINEFPSDGLPPLFPILTPLCGWITYYGEITRRTHACIIYFNIPNS